MTHLLPVLRLMTDALHRRLGPQVEAPVPDPLDHPALRRMSPRELADLPLPRHGPADALEAGEPEPGEPDAIRPAA